MNGKPGIVELSVIFGVLIFLAPVTSRLAERWFGIRLEAPTFTMRFFKALGITIAVFLGLMGLTSLL